MIEFDERIVQSTGNGEADATDKLQFAAYHDQSHATHARSNVPDWYCPLGVVTWEARPDTCLSMKDARQFHIPVGHGYYPMGLALPGMKYPEKPEQR